MKFKITIYYFILFIFLVSCNNEREIEKFDFQNNYKFNSEIAEKVKTDTVAWKHQISASEYAKKGNYKKALEEWSLAFKGRNKNYTDEQIDSIKSKYKVVPAIDFIIEKSKSNQVIIINEAHHNSSNRAFVNSLLKELYANGYENLGAEALTNGADTDSLLNERNYPIQETGYYIKDPQFGNLIRNALEIGYNIFPYEHISNDKSPHSGPNPREIGQAKNINTAIDKNPNEKFLIYCGFDHALEGPNRSWGKAMAGRLSEYSGINPLTINQVAYSQKSKPEFNHPLLKVFKDIKVPFVLVDKNNNPYRYEERKGWSDIAVFQPQINYVKGRPDWLLINNRKLVEIDLSDLKINFPVMVMAFKMGENINKAVPTDIIEVENINDNSPLVLKEGTYTIVVTNIKNNALKFEKVVK